MWREPRCVVLALIVLSMAWASGQAWAGAEDWNDAEIRWRSYEDGLREAKQTRKPICLIFYTKWCPHCANYARVFRDPELVKKAQELIMIRVDADARRELSEQYKPDGAYVPRSFFLSPDGTLDPEIHAGRERYRFFYDEHNAKHILSAMEAALRKYGARKATGT